MGSVRTPILGRPRPLPRHRRAAHHTLNCEEPYYSYIWSEVLDADTVEWFRENGGLTRENGERLLGVGGSKDPLEAYRDFRGRDAEIAPLLKRRGLES